MFTPVKERTNEEPTVLTSLTVEKVIQIALQNSVALHSVEEGELRELIANNQMVNQFAMIVNRINNIDKRKSSGAGLSQSEKLHFNELQSSMESSKPTRLDSISQTSSKIKTIVEKMRLIVDYKNIIALYSKYFETLQDPKNWDDSTSDIKNEWLLHQHVAQCDSEALLVIYDVYLRFEASLTEFKKLLQTDLIKTKTNIKTAMLLYCMHLSSQITHLKSQAINSMVLRLQSADTHCDIHYDDVIHDTIEKIEHVKGKQILEEDEHRQKIFEQLQARRRRGMTFQHIRRFITCIQAYCKISTISDEAESAEKKIILAKLNTLSMMKQESSMFDPIAIATPLNPVINFVFNRINDIRRKISESILLKPDLALIWVDDFNDMIMEARSCYQSVQRKSKNPSLERRLDECQDSLKSLVHSTFGRLCEQVHYQSSKVVQECLTGQFGGLFELHQSIRRLQTFHKQYNFLLQDKNIALQVDFLFYVLRYVDDHRDILNQAITRDRLAALIASYYWPIPDKKRQHYESIQLALSNRLLRLNKHFNHSFFHDPYLHYTWMIFFLEEVLSISDYPLARHRALSIDFKRSWDECFPVSELLMDTGDIIVVPDVVSSDLDEWINLKTSNRRAFILDNVSLIRQINSTGTYISNVVIPFVSVFPFIDLFNIQRNAHYISLMDRLHELMTTFNKKIDHIISTPSMPRKTINMLVCLKQFYNSEFDTIYFKWQSSLANNLDLATSERDLTEYLRNETSPIDLKKLKGLIQKINDLFKDQKCSQTLLDKLELVCARILVGIGLEVLTADINSFNFVQFIQLLNRVAGIREFGDKVIHKVTSHHQISRLLVKHLEQFDGSRPIIGGLITVLFPPNLLTNNDVVQKYILPYAKKRLEYILSAKGKDIQFSDVSFFEIYADIPECRLLFSECQQNINETITTAIANPQQSWDLITARIIELFGEPKEMSIYRARAIVNLVIKTEVTPEDEELADTFIQSLLRWDEPIVAPELLVTEDRTRFETFLDHYVDNSPWTIVRERVFSVFGQELVQRYHTRCMYKFLNNKSPEFGIWAAQQLESMHLNDFFGDNEVDTLSSYAMRLLEVAKDACHDLTIQDDQGQAILVLVNYLKQIKIFFHQISSNLGDKVLKDVNDIEKGINLVLMSKRLLSLFIQEESTIKFNNESIYKLLLQILAAFAEIENKEMVSAKSIIAYLDFIVKVNAQVPSTDLSELPYKYFVGIFSFHLTLIEHLKKIIIIITKANIVNSVGPQLLLYLVNSLDDNEKLDAREANFMEQLEQSPEWQEIAVKVVALARNINVARVNLSNEFHRRLLMEAASSPANDAPTRFAVICVKKLIQVDKQAHLSSAYIGYLIQTIHNAMDKISCIKFAEFGECFIESINEMTKIAQISMQNDLTQWITHNIWSNGEGRHNRLLQPLLTAFHHKYISHVVLEQVMDYVVCKIDIKHTNKQAIFQKVCINLNNYDLVSQVAYVKKIMGIKEDYNARKIILFINLHNKMTQLFDGRLGIESLLNYITTIRDELQSKESSGQKDYYKANQFKELLEFFHNLAKTSTIQEALLVSIKKYGTLRLTEGHHL